MQIATASRKHKQQRSLDMGSTVMMLPSLQSLRQAREPALSEHQTVLTQTGIANRQFKIRLANLPAIRREAGMLIQERYAQRGYGTQELCESPHRLTIVAYEGGNPIGTLSVGFDSPAGLLSDALYRTELDHLRSTGRKVCEFIKLAVNVSSTRINTLAALFHVAFIHAHRVHHFDEVVMEVNPHHVKFYKHALGFRELGPERINQRVNAPAVLMQCAFAHIDAELKRCGGGGSAHAKERSIYPYGFSPREAEGIFQRLSILAMHA